MTGHAKQVWSVFLVECGYVVYCSNNLIRTNIFLKIWISYRSRRQAIGAAAFKDAVFKNHITDLEGYSLEDKAGGLVVFVDKEAVEQEILEDPSTSTPSTTSTSSTTPASTTAAATIDEEIRPHRYHGQSHGRHKNRDANKMKRGQPILERRNLVQFARIVKVYNSISPLYFIFYGNWWATRARFR